MSDIIDINVTKTVEQIEITVEPNLTTVNINTISGGSTPTLQQVTESGATTDQDVEFTGAVVVPDATTENQAVNLGQLDNKVDKVTGKSLILDTEITRLADVTNFDNAANETALDNRIPLSGTEVGKPITGDLEMATGTIIKSYDAVEGKTKQISFQDATLEFSVNNNVEVSGLLMDLESIIIGGTISTHKGLIANQDFSGNNDGTNRNIYPQTGWVQDAIADAVTTGVSGSELTANKNQSNGYCGLDSGAKVPIINLPDAILGQLVHGGMVNCTTMVATLTNNAKVKLGTASATITLTNNTAAITGYVANEGLYYIATVNGAFAGISFEVGDWLLAIGSSWQKVDNTDAVASVNGQTGPVNLTTASVSENTNLYFTTARVLATLLTGISFATGGSIVSTDSVLVAFGKIQKQLTDGFTGSNIRSLLGITTLSGSNTGDQSENNIYLSHDFTTVNVSGFLTLLPVSSGTIAVNGASTTINNFGVARITSSTTANSGFAIRTVGNCLVLKGGEVFTEIFNPLLFTNTTHRTGLHDSSTSASPANGVFFRYSGDGLLTLVTANNSVQTTSATITTLSLNTWYKVRFTVNSNATSVLGEVFDASGTLISSVTQTTNIPTTARLLNVCSITTNSGTTALALLDVDFMSLKTTLTR